MSNNVLYEKGKEYDTDLWDDKELIKAYDKAVSNMKVHLDISNDENSNKKKYKGKKNKKSKNMKKNSSQEPSDNVSIDVPVNNRTWQVGDYCSAIYEEDGIIYNATIRFIDRKNQTCIINFTDYGNIEEKHLTELQDPEESFINSTIDSLSEEEVDISSSVYDSDSTPRMSGRESPVPPHSTSPNKSNPHRHNKQSHGPCSHTHFTNNDKYHDRITSSDFKIPHMFSNSHNYSPSSPPHHCRDGARSNFPPPPPPLFLEKDGAGDEAMYSMLMSWYLSGYHTGYYQGLQQSKSFHNGPTGRCENHKRRDYPNYHHQH